MENIDKVFFIPGDLVTIKHDLPNKPTMLVKGKETKTIKVDDSTHFLGIKCFWFTTEGLYQESIYNTKDLQKVDSYSKQDYNFNYGTSGNFTDATVQGSNRTTVLKNY